MKNIFRSWKFWVIVILTGTVVYPGIRDWRIQSRYEEADQKAAELRKEYVAVMKKELPAYFKDEKFVTGTKIDASSKFIVRNGERRWVNSVTITLLAEKKFDLLMDDVQYDYLHEWGRTGEKAIYEVRKKKLPHYGDISYEFSQMYEKRYGTWYYNNDEYDCFIKTENNTYEYAKYVDDYFVLNGEDHYTTKHKKEIAKEKQEKEQERLKREEEKAEAWRDYISSEKRKKSTTQKSYGDPIDPDDYDIEGYYEDYKDEFEDFDDAYDAFLDDEDAWEYYR